MGKKLRQQIAASFGSVPDVAYFSEDMQGIRAYHEYRLENGLDPFTVDDITWKDLSMADVFKRMNAAQTTSGEQVLYHMLRTPAVEEKEYTRRRSLIQTVQAQQGLRLDLQCILARIGKCRAATTSEVFSPSKRAPWLLAVSICLSAGLLLSLIGLLFSNIFIPPLTVFVFANPVFYMVMSRRLENDLSSVNYAASMVWGCLKMKKLAAGLLGEAAEGFFAAGDSARSIARYRGITFAVSSDLTMIINLFVLTDLIAYAWLRHKLARHSKDIFIIHESLGMIDAAIAVASYRQSVPQYCEPEIRYEADLLPSVEAAGMVHPLVDAPVPNDIQATGPILLTGSNASGKSTFLKGIILNVLLAQSVCTALCDTYRATSFRAYSSMAISDNIMSGDSYFIAELKSIRRIADVAIQGERVLCVIDEVLRGTNTAERIAASCELLASLTAPNVLCIAATHDGELCTLLPAYRLMHFEETISQDGIHFDYKIKEGPATTRNAIRLLAMLGFDEGMVTRADDRVQRYLATGKWAADSENGGRIEKEI